MIIETTRESMRNNDDALAVDISKLVKSTGARYVSSGFLSQSHDWVRNVIVSEMCFDSSKWTGRAS